ncbi:MAG: response regulator, partial [Salinisphaeraceae bacterium]|nr:response regulator [Salinisphaeraceae bacterium]
MNSLRTLYADDVVANRRYLKAMLEKLGLPTDVAEDGLQAMDAWNQDRHSLVLLDINMPGMNGAEVST